MLVALYQTKKALKEAVGQALQYKETSIAGAEYNPNGIIPVVGPNEDDRTWFATVTMQDGKIVKVR